MDEIERLKAALKEAAKSLAENEQEIERLRAVVGAALKQDNPCDELIEAIAALEVSDG